MATDPTKYKVADYIFEVCNIDSEVWDKLKWHYEPFITTDTADGRSLSICIKRGAKDMGKVKPYFADDTTDKDDIALRVFKDNGEMTFELQPPGLEVPDCWLTMDYDCNTAQILINEDLEGISQPHHASALTSAMQLAYIMTTSQLDILMAHASSIAYDGKAYLFIAKSGTGKSTHSRLWLENIKDCILLNDDHPIIRIYDDRVLAYGSPWSGKTHCYKNLVYPLGAIIRIRRAPYNKITRQSPIQAYASISTSFSGFRWHRENADLRHRTLERLITNVPCFVLDCRPDAEAAIVCHEAVTRINGEGL